MALYISLINQKGGVGKTTMTLNLANSFKENVSVCVVDLDPQGSITTLKDLAEGFQIVNDLSSPALSDADVIFIDTPPYLSPELTKVIALSDLIIIPTKAGIADLFALKNTVKLVKEHAKPGSRHYVLLNMIKHGTTLTQDIKDQINSLDIPLLNSSITDRVNYVRSIALSKGIYGIGDNKGEKEIDNLTKEILLKLQQDT